MTQSARPVADQAIKLLVGAATSAALLTAGTIASAADQIVVIYGWQVDFGDRTNRDPGSPFGGPSYSIDDLCRASSTVGSAMETIVNQIEQAAVEARAPVTIGTVEMIPGAPTRRSIREDLRTVRDGVCNRDDMQAVTQPFAIAYSSCRMTMVTPSHEMLINLPESRPAAEMWMMEAGSNEIITVELTSSLNQMPDVVGKGWSDQLELTPQGDSIEVEIGPPDNKRPYTAQHYKFESTGGLGKSGVGALGQSDVESGNISMETLGNLVTVESSGDVWISDSAPGFDIVRSFYDNFTSTVETGQAPSFFSGIIQNNVVMFEKGMPLRMDQTTASRVMGRTSVSGASEMWVANIELMDLNPEWCSLEMQIPEGYEVTDINQQISDALGGGAPSSEEMNAAMQQANEALAQMDEEDMAMLQESGFGDLLQQMMGGAAPEGQPGTGAAAAAAAGAGAASAGSASGPGMPPADELMGDSVTESVQKHLEALGYDVGNTNGEASMETTIAISTFQAEKGMDVTGEVSPQLLGVLSAEVDSRR